MSIRAMTRVWESSKAKGGSLLVLLAIADSAKDDGRNAWPSTHTLAWKSRLTFRQVRQILIDLQTAHELVVDPYNDDGLRLMHIRCVFEGWPVLPKPPKEWNARASAKTSEPRRKSPSGLTHSLPNSGEDCRDLGDSTPNPRQPTAGDPLVDPSLNLEQGSEGDSALCTAVQTVENSPATVRVVTKLVHTILDAHPQLRGGDLTDAVKTQCARLHLHDYEHVVLKAIDSALWQRQPRPHPGAPS